MKIQKVGKVRLSLAAVGIVLTGLAGSALADSSSSAHYQVNETQFGAGSGLQDCSDNYCAKTSLGDTGVGSTSSTNFTAYGGFNTASEPLLEIITSGGIQDLGVLDTSTTATASGQVKVRSYLSSGYVIEVTGNTPTQGTHNLTAMTTPTSSHAGAEQFGINFVANSNPSVGSDPAQVPNSTFSYGTVASDYSTANLFKYVSGDVVAQSSTATGETDYTMSLIINISNTTAAGHYSGAFSAVVVPTY